VEAHVAIAGVGVACGGTLSEQARPVHLAGAELGEWRHVCAFFNGLDEEYRTLMSYLTEGFEHGDRAFHIVDPASRADHLKRLAAAGIDVAGAEQRGQLEVRVWEQAYLRGGRFDQDAMLALIQEVLDAGHARGYPLTRLMAQMEWALEDRPGVDDLVEYETRLNYVLPRYKDPVV
jgi:hypothetical protein